MFNTACFYLNIARLSWLVAGVRLALHMLFAWACKEERYEKPSNVGYQGWVELPRVGPLAFRRMNGRLQYRW